METLLPRSRKELQRLTGKLVALGHFITRFTDELRPFFLAIRKAGANGWTDSCQSTFEKIKHYLMQQPILSSPLPGEKLYMYLVVSEWAISVVLFCRPSHKEQKPVYYVSRALADVETRYSKMEQTTLAIRSAAQKLRPYFIPPGGRAHRSALSQHPTQAEPDRKNASMGHRVERNTPKDLSNTRNHVEKSGGLCGLMEPLGHQDPELRVYSDSQLVVRHVQKEYEAKDERMARYLTKVRDTLQQFAEWTVEKIKRTKNGCADALAGIAASLPIKEAILLPINVQANPSVTEASTCNTIEASQVDDQQWTEAIIKYLQTGTLPEEPRQAHKARVQATRFTLIGGHLYKRSFIGPYLRCLNHSKASKWVEAEVYASIKDKDVTKFVWKNIICHFGIPQTIIADNDPQFDSITFRNFCSELNIRNLYATPRYPQSNGQVEATNKTLITVLKKRLEQTKGK
ncbi:uncharacterized protein LOC117928418 [Vitis riparia]|uniref:uncharacterized protein LOC117928418 n=1 Tax=Vitis riparia TaxID=96939 RepID=UPI00155A7413|nr:uncharacterized protein LOC117928418 [Vitis riparia]